MNAVVNIDKIDDMGNMSINNNELNDLNRPYMFMLDKDGSFKIFKYFRNSIGLFINDMKLCIVFVSVHSYCGTTRTCAFS